MASAVPGLEVVVVGGGPAGLSAALLLARCRRRVLVLDTGRPRNAASRAMHGYLTRDGMMPAQWLRIARKEVEAYGVQRHMEEVVEITPVHQGFRVRTATDRSWQARKVLVATGVRDTMPGLPGLAGLYGISAFHCPYCDGWEVRDRTLAAYGRRNKAVALALDLHHWSSDVILFTDGPAGLRASERAKLERAGIRCCTVPIARLQGRRGMLEHVVLRTGERIPRQALFFSHGHALHCDLPVQLGCATCRTGEIVTDRKQRTGVPGLFVAGDAAMDIHFISVACAEGARAAVSIHRELRAEDGFL